MTQMSKTETMTAKERFVWRLLRWAPWLSFLLFSLPAPIVFLFLWLVSTGTAAAAFYIFLALISFLVGSFAGILSIIFFLIYRKRWEKRLRERLATDGITADELPWFMSELTTAERQTLKGMEAQNPLLADAYKETLASRLTATRVVATAKRELLLVERRLNRAALLQGTDTASLQEELRHDKSRLERVRNEGSERLAESQARLQMIEAAASRGASYAEIDFALKRLDASRGQMPLALETARLELQAREEAERDIREQSERASLKEAEQEQLLRSEEGGAG